MRGLKFAETKALYLARWAKAASAAMWHKADEAREVAYAMKEAANMVAEKAATPATPPSTPPALVYTDAFIAGVGLGLGVGGSVAGDTAIDTAGVGTAWTVTIRAGPGATRA